MDLESGNLIKVEKDDYNKLKKQVTDLGVNIRKGRVTAEGLASLIDVLRKIVMLGTVVVIVLLIVVVFLPGSVNIDLPHKEFAFGFLMLVCTAFLLSLWIAKGNPYVVLCLIAIGGSVFSFTLGYTVCGIKTVV